MHPVIVMLVFFVKNLAIGATLVGATDGVAACQELGAKAIMEHQGQEPKDSAGNVSKPFIVCIDTAQMNPDPPVKKDYPGTEKL